jgi:pimeloyl-ACP methyl ester carboxylesterase
MNGFLKILVSFLGSVGFILLFSSCFRKFRKTEKDLDKYYQTHSPRPVSNTRQIGKHQLHWMQTGADTLPLLLFIHGAPGAWYGYLNLLSDPQLLSSFSLASVDRPGYNLSSKGGKVLDIETQGDLISTLFREDTTRTVYLVGRSYGAPIAAYLAAKFPNQVKGLMLVAPAAHPGLEKFWWFSPIIQYSPVRWLLPKPIRTASSEKYAHVKALKNLEPYWCKVNCPTQILQGGKDFIVHPNNSCFVDSVLISAPRLVRFLPDNGHLITVENPGLVKNLLLNLQKGIL